MTLEPGTLSRLTSVSGDRPDLGVVLARPYSARPAGLGLGEPLSVLGGSFSELKCITDQVRHHWCPAFATVVAEAVDRAAASSDSGFGIRSVLLSGEPGAGRTHVARRLAYAAGLPHAVWDIQAEGSVGPLRGRQRGPDLVLPRFPALVMAASGCANPIVTVIGVDTLGEAAQNELAWMIDPRNAGRCAEDAIGAFVDLGRISWVVQHDGGDLNPFLRRLLEPVHLPMPMGAALRLHAAEVLAEACIDENAGDLSGEVIAHVLQELASRRTGTATRDLYALACRLVASAT